ncbi:MAG TPA: TolC family protein [Planctomycetota bacterium]|nr:TolC family protein [Planctomycetota bacterium]
MPGLFNLCAVVALGLAGSGCEFDADYEPQPNVRTQAAAQPVPAGAATSPAVVPGPAAPSAAMPESTHLTVQQAVVSALENNPSFQVDRYRPPESRTAEEIQRAAFDPTLTAGLQAGQDHDRADLSGRSGDRVTDGNSAELTAGIKQTLPTGTAWKADVGANYDDSRGGGSTRSRSLNWDAGVTQALLKGGNTDANYASLRQAKIDTRISEFELRGAAETLVGAVEQSYWNTVLADRTITIYQKSLDVADQQVTEVKERIAVGRLAESELAAAEAEAASSREQLIDARGTLAKEKLGLLKLLSGPSGAPDPAAAWHRDLELDEAPETALVALEPADTHAQVALQERPDLNQARLEVQRGELDIVRTRNGLLPQLDLFLTLGGSRYADSFTTAPDADGRNLHYTAGLNLTYPLGNRDAEARHARARLTDAENREALRNMEDLVQQDVRTAYVDVQTAAEKIAATAATRALRQKTLDVENEKFRVGKSTSFLVAQAQRDLVISQIAELEAVVRYRQALLSLYRLEGSLLQRRGIQPAEVP